MRRLRAGESKVPSTLTDVLDHLGQIHRPQLVFVEECSPLHLLRCVFGERTFELTAGYGFRAVQP